MSSIVAFGKIGGKPGITAERAAATAVTVFTDISSWFAYKAPENGAGVDGVSGKFDMFSRLVQIRAVSRIQ